MPPCAKQFERFGQVATDEERLLLTLEARTALLERNMKNASKITGREFKGMERQAKLAAARMNAAFAKVNGLGGLLAGGFAGAGAAKGAQALIDSSIKIENTLKSAGLAGADLSRVYDQLFDAAQRNAVPISDLATLYGRASLAAKDLGASQDQLVQFADNVALSLRAGGQSATESAGALLQLGQAISGTKVQAEEYNSLIDGAPALLQAVAAGMKETGDSVASLTRLVKDGKVSSKAFFDAFAAGAPILQDKVAGAEQTVSSGFVRLYNVLTDTAGKFNKSTESAKFFGTALGDVSSAVANTDFEFFIRQLSAVITAFNDAKTAGQNFFTEAGRWTGLDNIGKALAGPTGERTFLGGAIGIRSTSTPEYESLKITEQRLEVERKIKDLQDSPLKNSPLVKRDIALYQAQLLGLPEQAKPAFVPPRRPVTPTPPPKVKPITLADYPVDPTGGGGTAKRDKEAAAIQREKERVSELITELEFERSLIGKSEVERERMNALRQAGAAATDEQREKIKQLVTASYEENKALEETKDRLQDINDTGRDVADGVLKGLLDGAKGADILSDALKRVGDTLLNDVLDSIFKVNSASGSGNGILGGILSFFSGGGSKAASSDPWAGLRLPGYAMGTNSAPGGLSVVGEKGPELMNVPRGAQIIPNHKLMAPVMPSLSGGTKSGQTVNVSFNPVIDNRGASVEAVARTQQQLDRLKAELPARVVMAVRDANNRNVKF